MKTISAMRCTFCYPVSPFVSQNGSIPELKTEMVTQLSFQQNKQLQLPFLGSNRQLKNRERIDNQTVVDIASEYNFKCWHNSSDGNKVPFIFSGAVGWFTDWFKPPYTAYS